MHSKLPIPIRSVLIALLLSVTVFAQAQKNVVQPGDPIIASSSNSPGSEGVANAIDGTQNKYLNFDSGRDGAVGGFSPSGFVVTPSVGLTRVTGIAMQSANDAPERDPKNITIEGSNDDTITSFNSGTWELIAAINDIPAWADVFGATNRYKTQTFSFPNQKAYKHYRWTVKATTTANTCCMQIAEVQLLGRVLPGDVTQPGDPIIASSANSPGSEGVANVIDGTQNKYLNFDSGRDGAVGGFSPSGFVVTPSLGRSLVTGITMESANDAPERDPKDIKLEGSNDDTVSSFSSGNWETITVITNIPAWADVFGATNRYKTQTFLFDNYKPFKHYRWTVTATTSANTCCMQIAEVELLGTGAPQDVTQPGDPIIASSANSPGSEGVANAIDGTQNKYLNFDSGRDGAVSGFSPSGFVVTPSIGATVVIGMTLQSANDAPERDPKDVTIEGSNDDSISSFNSGTWELVANITNIPAWADVFGATNRYKVQEFYFPNNKAYKHYRWTVKATTSANTCCMQIAEVELLAESSNADCNKARFLTQPTDTPALEGSKATFSVVLNGPWPLRWLKNGTPIPGATGVTYTTDPVTAANQTNVYSAQIVGCEESTRVRAYVFTPSTTKSIGVNFQGGGANGTPTAVTTDDIAGIHQQAHWNNVTGGSGDSSFITDVDGNPVPVLDSNGQQSDITFNWTTSGEWGAGTGDGSSTARLLNGLVYANPGTTANITFLNVPSGTHSLIVYTVNIPLQFQNANFTVAGATTETYYVRTMNSDEYNPAPGYYRGSSTDPNTRTIASYIRFDNVKPASDGSIILTWDTLTSGFDRGAGVDAVQLLLNSTSAGTPPAITSQPQPTVVPKGGTAVLSVTATGTGLTYQWRKNGKNLPNGANVSGATTSTLVINDFQDADIGIYSVGVFNAAGSALSLNASARISKYDINDGLAAYLKLDETSGATAANAAPGGKAGTVVGNPLWGAGKVGNAANLGGDTYIIVDDYPKAVSGIAASAWVNVDPLFFGDADFLRNAQGGLAVGGTNSGQFTMGLALDQNDSTMHLTAAIAAGPNIVRVTAPNPLTLGSFQHVAFTADGAQLRLYINGQQVAVADYQANLITPVVKHLSIGARLAVDLDGSTIILDPNTPNILVGKVDDVALWNRGLSADEVSKIFAAGGQGKGATTIVQTPPSNEPGKLTVASSNGQVTVTWTKGTLQTAPAVTGPWTDSNASSPLSEAAAGGAKFYRSVVK